MGPSAWRHFRRPWQSWVGFRGVVQCAECVQPWPVCGLSSTQYLSWHGSRGRHWCLVSGRWWSLSSASVSTAGASRRYCICLPSWTRCWWWRGCALHTCWGGAGRCHWSCLLRVCPERLPSLQGWLVCRSVGLTWWLGQTVHEIVPWHHLGL